MKSGKLVVIFAILFLSTTTFALAGRMCAVTGRDCDETISENYKGQTYFFSSKGAKRLFDLRPGRYTNSGAEQKICPVMGGKINKSVYTDYQDKRIYFCCPSCIETFKADPHRYLKKINEESNKTKKVKAKPETTKSSACSGCPSAASCSSVSDACSDDDDSCNDDGSCDDQQRSNSGSSSCSGCSK